MPCNRSSPSTKRFIKNPDSIHQDSNPTNVFTKPASKRVIPARAPNLLPESLRPNKKSTFSSHFRKFVLVFGFSNPAPPIAAERKNGHGSGCSP
jgi:hypothetical protein